MDETFTGAERAAVFDSINDWEEHTPIVFRRALLAHEMVTVKAVLDMVPNTIYVYRSPTREDTGCPVRRPMDGAYVGMDDDALGVEQDRPTGSAAICIFAPGITAQDFYPRHNEWRAVVTHEIGHALHLDHDGTRGSVMFPTADWRQADRVTCEDLRFFALKWTLPYPTECIRPE